MSLCKINARLLVNVSEISKIYATGNYKVIMELKSSKL